MDRTLLQGIIIPLLALTTLPLASCCSSTATDEAVIKGTFDTPFTGTVYVGHITQHYQHTDSIRLQDESSYEFRLRLDTADCYRVSTRPGYSSQEILVEKGGEYHVSYTPEVHSGRPSYSTRVEVVQGEEQKRLQAYREQLKPVGREIEAANKLYLQAAEAKDHAATDSLQKVMSRLFDRHAQIGIEAVGTYHHTLAALKIASELLTLDFPQWDAVYRQTDTVTYAHSYLLQSLQKKRAEAQAIWMEGTKAPLFTTTDLMGRTVSLSQFSNRYVLLDFWAPWCAPCRARAKELKKLLPALRARGIEVCGINVDHRRDLWQKATADDRIVWTNTSEQTPFDRNPIARAYKVRQLPTLFLVDTHSGLIVKQNPDEGYLLSLPEESKNHTK